MDVKTEGEKVTHDRIRQYACTRMYLTNAHTLLANVHTQQVANMYILSHTNSDVLIQNKRYFRLLPVIVHGLSSVMQIHRVEKKAS